MTFYSVHYGILATENGVHNCISDQGDEEGVKDDVSSDQECISCKTSHDQNYATN